MWSYMSINDKDLLKSFLMPCGYAHPNSVVYINLSTDEENQFIVYSEMQNKIWPRDLTYQYGMALFYFFLNSSSLLLIYMSDNDGDSNGLALSDILRYYRPMTVWALYEPLVWLKL